MGFIGASSKGFSANAATFALWMKHKALPLWSTLGRGSLGLFLEAIEPDKGPVSRPVRARTQTRQVYVYSRAGALGWSGPWETVSQEGLLAFCNFNGRPDGFFRTLVGLDGVPLDETVSMYDQAFALFALASAKSAGLRGDWEARAIELHDALVGSWPEGGGLTEVSDKPFQSNPHMHMLEACLAWEETSGEHIWAEMADRLVLLATTYFIDRGGGFLREFFASDWTPAPSGDGQIVEPGHQFEWCWLMTRYALKRGDPKAMAAAQTLYESGKRGIDLKRAIALDSMNETGGDLSERARLWPQTEWLKAALILAEVNEGAARKGYLADAEAALEALGKYLRPEGLWHDKLTRDGFVNEPAPATSLYHIMAAFEQLRTTTKRLGIVVLEIK